MGEEESVSVEKKGFKLFDFFAVCEYFEEKFNYDQVLKLPIGKQGDDIPVVEVEPKAKRAGYEYTDEDIGVTSVKGYTNFPELFEGSRWIWSRMGPRM